MAKKVRVEEAVGKPLAHDVIRYGPNIKAVLFKRGHVVEPDDIEKLKDTGDYFVYTADHELKGVHEEEAAVRMARAAMGANIFLSKPSQGKVCLLAKRTGLLRVKTDIVKRVNLVRDFIFATKRNNSLIKKGGLLAAVKVVPLSIAEQHLRTVEKILKGNESALTIIPLKVKKIALVVTGTEVYEDRIKDAFEPRLRAKLAEYGLSIRRKVVVPDDEEMIRGQIIALKTKGHDLILVASGMAVDPGDVTPAAIKGAGAEIISRGVPIFPGSMAMIAYLSGTLVMGLPACVIPNKVTSFDVLLPKILAKEKITRAEIAELGHGGLL